MACEEHRLKDAGDGMTEIFAEKILELAEAGETEPERLCSLALRRLSHSAAKLEAKPRNERSVPLLTRAAPGWRHIRCRLKAPIRGMTPVLHRQRNSAST